MHGAILELVKESVATSPPSFPQSCIYGMNGFYEFSHKFPIFWQKSRSFGKMTMPSRSMGHAYISNFLGLFATRSFTNFMQFATKYLKLGSLK